MSVLITPNAGLYRTTDDAPPPNTTGYILNNKPTIIDGNKNVEIGSAAGYNHVRESYGVDLGSSQTVISFKIYDDFGTGTVNNAQTIVLYGSDNNNWTIHETIDWPGQISRTGGSPGIWNIPLSVPATARYWRLYITGVFSVDSVSVGITEVEAYKASTSSVEVLTSIESSTWILAYTTANPHEFNIPVSSISGKGEKNYREPKLKHVCDHKLTSGTYTLNTCPRCLGDGHYYDIKINEDGQILQVFREDKLLQELEKITLTPLGNNTFHTSYGTIIEQSFTTPVSKELRETLLKQSIISAVTRLQTSQQLEIRRGRGFSPAELIKNIEKIEIYDVYDDPRSLGFKVHILTAQGLQVQEGTIVL